jgi:hypothetical protein
MREKVNACFSFSSFFFFFSNVDYYATEVDVSKRTYTEKEKGKRKKKYLHVVLSFFLTASFYGYWHYAIFGKYSYV